jgi:chorismate mutase/prephenate dehydratase
MTLEEIRREIDKIDAQLLPLFLRRMECTEKVAAVKREAGLPVRNEEREQQILDDAARKARKYGGEARILYSALLALSRAAQHRLLGAGSELREAVRAASTRLPRVETAACLGQSGSYSHEALQRFCPQAVPLFCNDFPSVFEAVADGKAEICVLPIENSSAGSVGEVYDLMLHYRFSILGALGLPVRHCLASSERSLAAVHTVYSHPQALRQCSKFLAAHEWEVLPCSSTSDAAEAAEASGTAAICSRCAAEEHGLNILAKEIQNVSGNRTRFLAVGKKMILTPDADKISVCFALPHRTGTLSGVLTRFAAAGLNLTKIESRPIPGKTFEYDFYLDFAGSVRDDATLDLLCALHDELPRFTFLGNYKDLEVV